MFAAHHYQIQIQRHLKKCRTNFRLSASNFLQNGKPYLPCILAGQTNFSFHKSNNIFIKHFQGPYSRNEAFNELLVSGYL